MTTASRQQRIGIVGMPPLEIIRRLKEERAEILDLDTPLLNEGVDSTAPLIPRVYCAILRTVVLNAISLQLDSIYIDVGPGKCDCALHVAAILEDTLAVPVIKTRNNDSQPFGNPLCAAEMELTEKFLRITAGVQSPDHYPERAVCPPTAAFWGVPPRDFSILTLFPATTHIHGWTRCMENKTPADVDLESQYNREIPTVFFAQSFCAKTALARHLASRHPHALYVDSDVTAGASIKAKIQAFLDLSGVAV